MYEDLKKEFQYYLDHQDELVKEYNGKVVVIKDQEVIGAYDSVVDAVLESNKTHTPGTFLVQRCSPGSADYTVTIY